MAESDNLRSDYAQTAAYWQQLVDVRFRLLTLVPTVSAAGIGVFGRTGTFESAAVGVVALVSLLAIAMYDLRNSTYHDLAVHRAKEIERRLELERTTHDWDKKAQEFVSSSTLGGVFQDREGGRRRHKLLAIEVWHDRALYLVYAASFGGWATVVARGALEEIDGDQASEWWTASWLYALVGLAAFAFFFNRLSDFDGRRSDDLGPATISS